jgi:hypothetical protein
MSNDDKSFAVIKSDQGLIGWVSADVIRSALHPNNFLHDLSAAIHYDLGRSARLWEHTTWT